MPKTWLTVYSSGYITVRSHNSDHSQERFVKKVSLGATEGVGEPRGEEGEGVRGLQQQGEEEDGGTGARGKETEGVPRGLR